MLATVFSAINNCILTLWSYLLQIQNYGVPILTAALGVFLIVQLSRFFIAPMFKGHFVSGSDSVKNKKDKK